MSQRRPRQGGTPYLSGSHDRPEHIAACLQCPLPDCVGSDNAACPQFITIGQSYSRAKRAAMASRFQRKPQ